MNLKMRVLAWRHKAWVRSDQGSAAIEFAFVAPIFFALMLGILEIGVMMFAQFALQNSVMDAARLIRTGQAHSAALLIQDQIALPKCAADNASDQSPFSNEGQWFKQQICCGVSPLIDDATCKSDVMVTVAAPSAGFAGDFNSLTVAGTAGTYFGSDPSNSATASVASQNTACQIVLVRANYNWPVWFPGLAKLLNSNNADNYLVNAPNGTHLLTATAAFRSEPFTNGVSGC
ncbi:MAG: pilus assembly protein [Alphaproteobacteria bacterium]|nr:pilus assembly protein [Alphaproteobacteria bacterium]